MATVDLRGTQSSGDARGLLARTTQANPVVTLRSTAPQQPQANSMPASQPGSIEGQYIRNLQNQIYYLELECKFLREQADKFSAAETARLSAEARAELSVKLREWNEEHERLTADLHLRDDRIATLERENAALTAQLSTGSSTSAAEKRELVGSVTELQRRVEHTAREVSVRDGHIARLKADLAATAQARSDREKELAVTQSRLEERRVALKAAQSEIETMRTELLQAQRRVAELEDHVADTSSLDPKADAKQWRDELFQLRLRLKDADINADQERALRQKIAEDCASLVRENAQLGTQVTELQHMLDRERSQRESRDGRKNEGIRELVELRDRDKRLRAQNTRLSDELLQQTQRAEALLTTQSERNARLADVEQKFDDLIDAHEALLKQSKEQEAEIVALQRDKTLLAEHVTEGQQRKGDESAELERLRRRNAELAAKLAEVTGKIRSKWGELEEAISEKSD